MIALYGDTDFEVLREAVDDESLHVLLFNASRLLVSRGITRAAELLREHPFVLYDATNHFGDDFCVLLAQVELERYERLRVAEEEKNRPSLFGSIANVVTELGSYVRVVACDLVSEHPDGVWRGQSGQSEAPIARKEAPSHAALIQDIIDQRILMESVATGVLRIPAVAENYETRRRRIANQLDALGETDPNPFATLWNWYEGWKARGLDTYSSRRVFLADLYGTLIDRLRRPDLFPIGVATGWERVDRVLLKARSRLNQAKSEEDFQGVGLLCREVLISLAQAVFDETLHPISDRVELSPTDFKGMLEAYLNTVLRGPSNKPARSFSKACLDLANQLQHDRSASNQDATLCLAATSSLVTTIAVVSGKKSHA